ncbi:MAG: ABC transporter substrate-binding protein [Bdellovibrionales bacterium]|nr:ABC transporter substrate-binding protein [Bdellovibrionales bacterium]
MEKMIKSSALALALVAVVGCTKKESTTGATNAAPAGDTILVGEVGSMTGSEATFGTSTHNGIELAFEQINAAGGVKGKKFKLITLDDQGKPDEAATAATKLITQDKIQALLGEVASSRSLAMAPIAQSNGVPMITPSSTNPKVTEQGDYIFRVCFIDPFQGTVMAKFALDTLKVKNVAVLRDVKNDYSVGLADFFTQTFTKNGGKVVVDQSFSAGDMDFKSQLTAIRAKKPEAIYVPGYYTEVGLIARQAKELGLNVPLMGGDGWDSPKLTEIGGKSIEGSYFSNHYSPEDQSPAVQKFVSEFKAKYGVIPDGLSAMGYDAAKVLADAMTRAPDLTNKAVRDAIATTKDFPGVTGVITLNEHRDPVKSAVVLKVAGGGYKYQTTVKP